MPESRIPMIGASGAVAGVLGGYVLLFPNARVLTVIPPFFWLTALPAWIFLGLWFVGQFFLGSNSGIAWVAHAAGFVAGLLLVGVFRPGTTRGPPSQPQDPRRLQREDLPYGAGLHRRA